jgi:hypothetical protein
MTTHFSNRFETQEMSLVLPLVKVDAKRGRLLCSAAPIRSPLHETGAGPYAEQR